MRDTFQAEQWLPYPVEDVFTFFGNPDNLPRLMPPWQATRIDKAVIVQPPSGSSGSAQTKVAGTGTTMTISFRPFPLSPFRVRWDAEIVEFTWNDHFCDVQHRGPFAYWRHCHQLAAEIRNGCSGTLVRDHLTYTLPLGLLGTIAQKLFMPAQLRAIFGFRQKRTAELLASPS